MLFHTWPFALFFLVFYGVYLAVKSTRLRLPWLLLSSYAFYAWWNPLYVALILYATTVDFLVVVLMAKSHRKRLWLTVSVANNLLLLGTFKYAAFLAESLNSLLATLGTAYAVPAPDLLLPVGISFFVFQSMSYTIDYYRGKVDKEPNFLRYAVFVSLFPRLVAGPIERASHVLPQLRETPKVGLDDVADGLSLFVVGFFKKVALADFLALYVDKVYGAPAEFQAPALLLATFAFAWQIYFDFSGYTDMARGIARTMGIRLMLNFNNPYLATSLRDFWGRWHISLSSWFKDYVYIPLGGNRRGSVRTYVNMCLTMVISGLWHGASWTFVIWGAVHAIGRCLTRWLEGTTFYKDRVPTFAKQLLVFGIVTFAWIFFKAQSLGDAWLIVTRIFTSGWADPACPLLMLGFCLAVWLYQFVHESRCERLLSVAPVRVGLVVLMVLYLAIFSTASGQAFIYVQF